MKGKSYGAGYDVQIPDSGAEETGGSRTGGGANEDVGLFLKSHQDGADSKSAHQRDSRT